ncbi:MAG: coproporphyrinogen-III oxidase family protein [Pseudomonadota bacterium]
MSEKELGSPLERFARRGFMTHLEPARKGFITNFPNFQHWKKTTPEGVQGIKPINIYIHIPFCAQQCSYCYYRTITGGRKSEFDTYVDALCQEIETVAKYHQLENRPVRSIYFGGGTPTLIDGNNLGRIIDALRKNLNIDDPEFTVEAEPVTLTQKKADALKAMGVNRISLGVQSLSDEIIKLSNRQDTEKKVLKAMDIASGTGAVVNIDLMSGLAGETQKTWEHSVQRAISTGVESITVYKTELFANTEYYKDLRNRKIELPSDDQELEFMQYAIDQFGQSDYLPWSFFTFTKGGRYEHIHAPSIWRGDDYYPFGTSAFGRLGSWLFQNTNDVDKYLKLASSGKPSTSRGHHLSSMDHMVRDILLEMKLLRLDLNKFQKNHGFKLTALCRSTIDELVEEDFITASEEMIELTAKGLLHGDYTGKKIGRALLELNA